MEPKQEENNGVDRFLVLKSYTFLAPLSDPILGSKMAPEPKRKENHRIYMFLLLKSYTFLAPLSDPIFGSEKAPEPKLHFFKTSVRGAKARATFRVTYPLDPCTVANECNRRSGESYISSNIPP